ncbi:MAG: hypothetical protein KDJ65_20320 [Anaerolineae bacterium]|nr:hypothetical protein [Anaerolineae bacterium]
MAPELQLSTKVKETLKTAEQALDSDSTRHYREFDEHIRQLEATAREAFQAKLQHDYKGILNKLEKAKPLTESEREMLKLLIVGEAKYYLKHENDLENWRVELNRLVEEIERIEATGANDIDSLLHIQALCRDARHILPDITYYYSEKERIDRFEKATSGQIDAEKGRILAGVIRAMMASEKM